MEVVFNYEDIIDSLSPNQVKELVQDAKDYVLAKGGLVVTRNSPRKLDHFNFMLFPTPWPRRLYREAKEVQKDFNLLVHKVCNDHDFIKEALSNTMEVDEFTRRIYDIYETTRQDIAQPISLGSLRSDYMINSPSTNFKLADYHNNNITMRLAQVELNTISSGGASIAEVLYGLGSFTLGKIGHIVEAGSPEFPANSPMIGISEGLALAWELYGCESAVILMIVGDYDKHCFDQKPKEHYLHHRRPSIRMIRRSLTALKTCASLQNKKLIVDGYEVAVAYYRSGYSPSCYPCQDEWDARLLVERSLAIKCPTAAMHLVGTKKMQQVFAQPGVVERFISDEKAVKRIRNTFTGLYSLDRGEEGEATYQMAIKNPERFVLKPQREGGGNNIFGEAIKTTLESKTPTERSEYILMDKIQSPSTKNYFVFLNHDEPVLRDVSSEFGVFGTFISDGDKLLFSREIGHLFRTKDLSDQEGGSDLGATTKDTPYLF